MVIDHGLVTPSGGMCSALGDLGAQRHTAERRRDGRTGGGRRSGWTRTTDGQTALFLRRFCTSLLLYKSATFPTLEKSEANRTKADAAAGKPQMMVGGLGGRMGRRTRECKKSCNNCRKSLSSAAAARRGDYQTGISDKQS